MTTELPKQRVLVLGGAGSIGSAIALAAANNHASVWIADTQDASQVLSALPGYGHRTVITDVTDPPSVEALIDQIWQEGGPDGIVYASGLLHTGKVADTAVSDIERIFAVNLLGAFTLGTAVARRIRAEPRPISIVYISSVAGLHGEAGSALYCATKSGLIGFMQSFAAEIAEFGCRANAVCPGNVDTPMLKSLAAQVAARAGTTADAMIRQLAESTAFRRLLTPAEIASACLWLLSPSASGVSGQTVVVDGPTIQAGPA
jgi:NAD(P)-dependent dehydrogenase (short-subunit alcohol dehydrogenase family)